MKKRKRLMDRILLMAALMPLAACAGNADGPMLLLYPHSTMETDFGGSCARVANISDALVYVPMVDRATWQGFIAAYRPELRVTPCVAK
jgi:hypothetical protein